MTMISSHEVRADDWMCGRAVVVLRATNVVSDAAARSATSGRASNAAVNTAAARAPAQGSAQEGYEVFLKYLPHSADETEVYNFFADCGAIVGPARLLRNLVRRSKGAGFITFVDEAGRNEALKRDGARFGGRNVSVTVAKRARSAFESTEQAFGTHTPAMLAKRSPRSSRRIVRACTWTERSVAVATRAVFSPRSLRMEDYTRSTWIPRPSRGRELEKEDSRFTIHHAPFGCMAQVLKPLGVQPSGVFLDLGISSPQFDDASRGFRPEQDGPLDLRSTSSAASRASEYLRPYLAMNFVA